MSWRAMCWEIGGGFIALRVCLRSIAGSYKSWKCGCGNKVLYFESRFDAWGSEKVFREPFNPNRLLRGLSPPASWSGKRQWRFGGFMMGSSMVAVGLLFWWKVRRLMPIGSRVKTCAWPKCLECIIYASHHQKIPHLTTSHSSCGPAGREGLMLQEDQGIACQRAIL